MFCFFFISVCQGDSGSGLCVDKKKTLLIGIMSRTNHNVKDCDPARPAFAESIPYHREWIRSKTLI